MDKVNMEGAAEGTGAVDDVLPEPVPSANSNLDISGLPSAPKSAPWVVKEEPLTTTRQIGVRTETNTERPGSIKNSNFMPVTHYIRDIEACSNYREMDLLTPDWKEYHRYRLCWVVRDDALAEYIEDMGPSSNFREGPVNIIGGEGTVIVESFATMKEIADGWRADMANNMPHHRFNMDPLKRDTQEFKHLLSRKVI